MYDADYSDNPYTDRLQYVAGILNGLGTLAAIVLVLIAIFAGMKTVANLIAPIIIFGVGLVLFLVLPLSLLLAIPRKTRSAASVGIMVTSYVSALWVWVNSLMVAFATVSLIWIIVGLCLAGIGIVPVALIGALLAGKWGIAGLIVLGVVLTLGLRVFAYFLASKSGPTRGYASPPLPPGFEDASYPVSSEP